jgi:uncharacterized caspase-like protein
MPQDTGGKDGHFQPSTVVRWHVFQDALQTATGRRLMFVDTCHSGGAYNARLVKDAHDAEIVVFSDTDSHTLAQERAELGHGAFTFALTQGLSGGAALAGDDVALTGLLGYVSREVNAITGGAQSPQFSLSNVKDFVIARK